ncbi:MAG: 50S ribosomal protein L1 [Rickettsiales bacterium]|nr:50S ribosomal protein L1 [Rickettsiales bacterium]
MKKTKKDNSKGSNKMSVKNLEEGITKLQEFSIEKQRKFVESLDVAINLGIDAKQSNQSIKGSTLLPHGSGKEVKVIVFTDSEEEQKIALKEGAKLAGLDDLIAKINDGFLDFHCCIATPSVMSKISKVAKKLGPRGLMPSPKNGTVTTDIKKAISDALKGKIDFKNDKSGTVHCLAGKINFETKALIENVEAILKSVKDLKPESSKGKYIKDLFLSTTMGPSVQIDVSSI